MNTIKNIQSNIKEMIHEFDAQRNLIVLNDDITLDTCYVNDDGEELDNIEIFTIYNCDGVLFGETNYGCIDLEDQLKDEDDWYTLEDIVSDIVQS